MTTEAITEVPNSEEVRTKFKGLVSLAMSRVREGFGENDLPQIKFLWHEASATVIKVTDQKVRYKSRLKLDVVSEGILDRGLIIFVFREGQDVSDDDKYFHLDLPRDADLVSEKHVTDNLESAGAANIDFLVSILDTAVHLSPQDYEKKYQDHIKRLAGFL